MAVVMLLQQWLLSIIIQCLIYSYVVQCSVSQTESADCEFPQFSAPPFPPTPSLSNYPLDPWTPGQVVPPWLVPNAPVMPWMPRQLVPPTSTPAQFGTPLLPQTPRQLLPPPSASSQTTASSPPARQLSPQPFIPEPSNSHSLPKIPRKLIPPPPPPPPPPPLARAQSNAPFLPWRPADIISPPLSTGESSTGSFPQTPQQQQSGSSSSFRQLQFGQQPFLLQGKSSSSSNRAKAIGTAVGVTLAITIIVAGVSICLILKCCKRRRREARNSGVAIGTPPSAGAAGGGKNLKGLIVDEKGRDMVYWRKDEQGNDKARNSFSTEAYDLYKERVRKENDNIPLIRGKSSTTPQPLTPIPEVNPRLQSQSAGVRFESGDKKSPVNALALAAPEARLPPLWPSVRKGLSKHTDRKENLKPLQREQVSINVDHPTTWGKHNGGSLR